MKNLKRQTIQDMNKKIKILEEKFNISMKVELAFDLKSVRTLGTCLMLEIDYSKRYCHSKIRLDIELIIEFGQDYLDDVLLHEICHSANAILNPLAKPHGKEFKQICRAVGIDGKASTTVCNDSKVLKARRDKLNINKLTYKCNCQEHKVTKRMHNSIQNGNNRRCGICSTRLTLCS